jgi:hypothetical protein
MNNALNGFNSMSDAIRQLNKCITDYQPDCKSNAEERISYKTVQVNGNNVNFALIPWDLPHVSNFSAVKVVAALAGIMPPAQTNLMTLVGCSGKNKYSLEGFEFAKECLEYHMRRGGDVLYGATGFGPNTRAIYDLMLKNPKLTSSEIVDLAISKKISASYDVNFIVTAILEEHPEYAKQVFAQFVADGTPLVLDKYGACISPYITNVILFGGNSSQDYFNMIRKLAPLPNRPPSVHFGCDIHLDIAANSVFCVEGGIQSFLQSLLALLRGCNVQVCDDVRHKSNQGYFSAAKFLSNLKDWSAKIKLSNNFDETQSQLNDFITAFYSKLKDSPLKYDADTKAWQKQLAVGLLYLLVSPDAVKNKVLNIVENTCPSVAKYDILVESLKNAAVYCGGHRVILEKSNLKLLFKNVSVIEKPVRSFR